MKKQENNNGKKIKAAKASGKSVAKTFHTVLLEVFKSVPERAKLPIKQGEEVKYFGANLKAHSQEFYRIYGSSDQSVIVGKIAPLYHKVKKNINDIELLLGKDLQEKTEEELILTLFGFYELSLHLEKEMMLFHVHTAAEYSSAFNKILEYRKASIEKMIRLCQAKEKQHSVSKDISMRAKTLMLTIYEELTLLRYYQIGETSQRGHAQNAQEKILALVPKMSSKRDVVRAEEELTLEDFEGPEMVQNKNEKDALLAFYAHYSRLKCAIIEFRFEKKGSQAFLNALAELNEEYKKLYPESLFQNKQKSTYCNELQLDRPTELLARFVTVVELVTAYGVHEVRHGKISDSNEHHTQSFQIYVQELMVLLEIIKQKGEYLEVDPSLKEPLRIALMDSISFLINLQQQTREEITSLQKHYDKEKTPTSELVEYQNARWNILTKMMDDQVSITRVIDAWDASLDVLDKFYSVQYFMGQGGKAITQAQHREIYEKFVKLNSTSRLATIVQMQNQQAYEKQLEEESEAQAKALEDLYESLKVHEARAKERMERRRERLKAKEQEKQLLAQKDRQRKDSTNQKEEETVLSKEGGEEKEELSDYAEKMQYAMHHLTHARYHEALKGYDECYHILTNSRAVKIDDTSVNQLYAELYFAKAKAHLLLAQKSETQAKRNAESRPLYVQDYHEVMYYFECALEDLRLAMCHSGQVIIEHTDNQTKSELITWIEQSQGEVNRNIDRFNHMVQARIDESQRICNEVAKMRKERGIERPDQDSMIAKIKQELSFAMSEKEPLISGKQTILNEALLDYKDHHNPQSLQVNFYSNVDLDVTYDVPVDIGENYCWGVAIPPAYTYHAKEDMSNGHQNGVHYYSDPEALLDNPHAQNGVTQLQKKTVQQKG